jgi:hypothetical protein
LTQDTRCVEWPLFARSFSNGHTNRRHGFRLLLNPYSEADSE